MTNADAKMVRNERADIIGGKGFFYSNRLFTRRPATHISPHLLKYIGMQSSNAPRSAALFQNCKSVAIAPQSLIKQVQLADGGGGVSVGAAMAPYLKTSSSLMLSSDLVAIATCGSRGRS